METAPNPQPLSLHNNRSQTQLVPLPYTAELPDPDEDELDLGQIFAVIRRRAILILAIATAVAAGVGVWTSLQPKKYEGNFKLLVEPVTSDHKLSNLSSMAGGLGASFLGGKSAGLDYDSQIEILQSPTRMAPIIQQLQARYPEIKYGSLVGGKKSPLSIARLNKTTKIIEIKYKDTDPEKVEFVLKQLADGYLKYSREDRQTNTRNGLKFIDDQLPALGDRVNKLQEKLQQFRQQYNLIDPEIQGKQLAEQVSKVKDQLLEAQTQVAQQQKLVVNLREQLGQEPGEAIALSVLSEAPRYQELLNQLQKVESDIRTESTRFKEASPQIQALVEKRNSLMPLLRQEAERVLGQDLGNATVTPKTFAFQNSIRLQLTEQMVEAYNQFQISQLRYKAIEEADKFYTKQLKDFPVIVRQYTDLQRELVVATSTLNELLAKREALRLEGAQQEVPWEMIAKPEIAHDKKGDPVPVSPSVPRNLVLGVFLGLMLGFGAAMLAERLDNVFHTPEEVKDATRLPLLGIIPRSESAKEVPRASNNAAAEFQYQSDLAFAKAFRALNTNIRFLNAGNPIHSLAISSATTEEGKSTVAVHLALAAAAMGQRVLLVDADMRWPQIDTLLGLPNKQGLSHAIATDIPLNEVIQRSPVENNLFVLTAGALPPDPIRLLSSPKMQNLMKQWQKDYDLVVYDTPPLLEVVDARLLAAYTDGIALVVSIGQTERPAILQAIEELQTSSSTVLGIIGNGVKGNSTNLYDDHPRYNRQNPARETLLIAERLDNVFHTSEDLKAATRLPLLGVIPPSDTAKELPSATSYAGAAVQQKSDFAFQEAFRALNTNIRLLNPDSPIRSLAISSATTEEGKSTVAVHLAKAAAAMGQRVLLVDADWRRPQIHTILGLPNKQGLSHAIAADKALNAAIARSPVDENLFVLTAGAIPPDPIRLLSSAKMQNLMKQWQKDYDLVVYDTPPLLEVVDARLLAAYTDGIALVASIAQTERAAIAQAIEELQTSSTTVLGIISNQVKGGSSGFDDDHNLYHPQNPLLQSLDQETATL